MIKKIITRTFSLYSLVLGSNTFSDISSIMPPITANSIPNIILLIIFFKKIKEIRAPSGSAKEAISVYKNAFFLLLVE